MTSRLRVGIPPPFDSLPDTMSVGRIWNRVLAILAAHVRVVVIEPHRRLPRRGQVDVWMTDGHQGPLDVRQPVVAHLHEATWTDPDVRQHLTGEFLGRHEEASRLAALHAARIVTVSKSSRAQISAAYGVDPDQITVAYNGVDHDIYNRRAAGHAAALIVEAGGDPEVPYVLFVSSVHPRKNLPVLREAMAHLRAHHHSSATLVLVAAPAPDRPDSSELMTAATAPLADSSDPILNFAGASDREVAALMADAACFCLPSAMEGFGMAVAEAMACGAPVVVSDRGSLPEVVGDAGIVVTPEPGDVAAAIQRVLDDEQVRTRLASRAVRRARTFTWEATAEAWLQALHAAT